MLTVEDVMNLKPCAIYTREMVENLFAGKPECGLQDFLSMDRPDCDKITVILWGNLVSAEKQQRLKSLYLSRINKMRAPRLWREANNGNCADAAHAAQKYMIITSGATSQLQRREAIDNEAAWQLSKLIEAIND